jgi:hypothetical protein
MSALTNSPLSITARIGYPFLASLMSAAISFSVNSASTVDLPLYV